MKLLLEAVLDLKYTLKITFQKNHFKIESTIDQAVIDWEETSVKPRKDLQMYVRVAYPKLKGMHAVYVGQLPSLEWQQLP